MPKERNECVRETFVSLFGYNMVNITKMLLLKQDLYIGTGSGTVVSTCPRVPDVSGAADVLYGISMENRVSPKKHQARPMRGA